MKKREENEDTRLNYTIDKRGMKEMEAKRKQNKQKEREGKRRSR